jgi:hypothetical protein
MIKGRLFVAALLALLCTCGATPAQTVEPGFVVGFEQRLRNENWNNILDFNSAADDEREQIRWRTRFWVSGPVSKNVNFFVGLSQETNQKMGKDRYFDEIFFEHAFIDINRLFIDGLSLRVGRQNFIRGDGFLFSDGGAGDGSRTRYFNGFDLAYKRKKTTYELIGISNPYSDRYLPRIHNQRRVFQNWDDQALGLYVTNRSVGPATLEGYWIYKREINDRLAVTDPQHQVNRFLNTVGGRISTPLAKGWLAVGEFAGQFGHQADHKSIAAKGGWAYLRRTFQRTKWTPYAQVGYLGLSGADPYRADANGSWDPLFARWPTWSELYIYTQMGEVGISYWTNMSMPTLETGFAPSKRIKARVTYNHMSAFHTYGSAARNFGTGTFRGHNIQGRVDFVLNRFMVAHALYERMTPGAFHLHKDPGYFLRFETSFLVKNLLPGKPRT